MKSILSTAAFALGASAGVLKQRAASSCCFGITVNGGYQAGSLGQLDDGQNRVGPGFGGASYCIQGSGITDEAGRGCIIAEPSTQFQCDLNKLPTSGFSISSAGEIAYNGNTTFYECAATADMQFNLYITPAGAYCTEVTLTTTGGTCAASSSSAVPTTVMQTTTATAPASTVTVPGMGSTVTLPASTITVSGAGSTVTLPASTITVSGAGSTVTLPASAVTVSGAGSTVTLPASTVTVSGAGSTVTLPASTVTVSGAGSTVTLSGAGNTVTLPASTITVSSVQSCVASTITVSSVQSCVASTVTVTGAGKTVVQTSEVTEVMTAPTTIVQTAEVTDVKTIPTTLVQTAKVTETQTIIKTTPTTAYQTVVETAPASIVELTKTVIQSASSVAPTTVVSVVTTSIAPSSTPVAPSSATSSSATPSSTSCPPNLSGTYQYPHLIVPVNSSSPNTAYGTQYFGTVSPSVSTIFNFDIPSSYSGNTCSLIFLLPTKAELETSDYTLTGSGSVEVVRLISPATSATTYANQPAVASDLGSFDISVGSSTVIATTACAAGETVTYELKATGSYSLYFFEDWNPSPLGLFIREC